MTSPSRRHQPRPTGVALLDDCAGGAAPGLGLVLAGETGTGRTVLCLEATAAALRAGERVVFLTSEPAASLLRQGESLGLDLMPSLSLGRLTLLELAPDASTTTRAYGVTPLFEGIAEESPEADLLVIDALTALTVDLLDERPLREAVTRLLTGYTERQRVITAADTEMLRRQPALERALSDACGTLIHLRRDEDGERHASVLKSRFGSGSAGRVRFRIGATGTSILETEPASVTSVSRAPVTGPRAPESEPVRVASVPETPQRRELDVVDPQGETPAVDTNHVPQGRFIALVVNADPQRCEATVKGLADHYDVVTATSAFGCLSAVLSARPDVIVLDLKLPDLSGYEVLSALQRMPIAPPVLAVSENLARAADRIRALVLGAADVLPATCARYEILRKIEDLLRVPRARSVGPLAVEPQDLLALAATSRRQVEPDEFEQRVQRAYRFGDKFGIASCMVAIEASSPEDLEVVLQVCEKLLRAEDALLPVGERRALLLLVAAELARAPVVVERIKRRTDRLLDVVWGCRAVGSDAVEIADFGKYFESFSLESW